MRPGALLLVAMLAACRAEPPAPAPRAPGPDARSVAVVSRPEGAEVLVGGASRCRTPCTFRVDPGRYRVVLRLTGYLPWDSDLVVHEGADARVEASLVSSH